MVIVAAVDRSDRAETVVKEAGTLAKAFDETVHVVHVLTRSEFIDMGRTAAEEVGGSISMDKVKQAAADISAEATEDLNISSESVGLMGDPADSVINYANEQDARYIVVAGRKRSPTGKAIFGSVAQSLLLNAERPVLSMISKQT